MPPDSIQLSFASPHELANVVEDLAKRPSPDLEIGEHGHYVCTLCGGFRPDELIRYEPDPRGDPISWHDAMCPWRRACELTGMTDRWTP